MFRGQTQRHILSGRYRLLSSLGSGGMGTVWRAYDQVLQREVAVKEVRAPLELAPPEVDRLNARLEREAWAAARITHPNVVTVYDVAKDDGRPWIVMELVRGSSMAELIEAERVLDPRRTARIAVEVLAALRAAHAVGVLHRDVKPANVLLAHDGRVVLTDFGIAMVEGTSALTMADELVGSPEYLAPERALGRQPGPASDLWSLGILLYAAVEGRSPFRQTTPLITLRAVVDEELPPPHRAGPLTPLIEALLSKDPERRPTMEQTHRELCAVRDGDTGDLVHRPPTRDETTPALTTPTASVTPRRRRRSVVLAAGTAALLLVGGGGLAYGLLDGGRQDHQAAPGATEAAGSVEAPVEPQSTGAVDVTVAAETSVYEGSCPPAKEDAPTFTATFTVDRTPAQVTYRWVTTAGSVTDGKWETLTFAAAGDRKKVTFIDFSAYRGESFRTLIGVEIREPEPILSEKLPLAVSCEGRDS
ncbi:serine/threonine-protein kinase [Streptomyces sp. NPDC046860]|uniref:serine/threonine-protein kinase n=1 Tax=Streptomyces sp. NPDC046860 TaxID=3154495 RepID=UPI0033F075F4